MSTRSIIARVGEHEGTFSGRYVHCDGMPESMGKFLWDSLYGHFKNDLSAMLHYFIDAKHAQAGWSSLVGHDLNLVPGYTMQKATADGAKHEVYSKRPDYRRPQSFAGRGEKPQTYTEKDLEGTDCEWLYVFDESERKLFVRDLNHKEDVAIIELDGDEPDWSLIECGENLERCLHYAWKHNLTPRESNLSTQTYLGREPLEFRDAVAFIVNGKRYAATGSGGNSDYLRSIKGTNYPPSVWISSVRARNGKTLEVPTATITPEGYKPYSGVQWIYPPTKDNPREIIFGGVA